MTDQRMSEEFARVVACNYCQTVGDATILRDRTFNVPQPGYVGSKYSETRVLLVGQNPGISPPRFRNQDTEYAKTLVEVATNATVGSMKRLQGILDAIIPTWPVTNNYFPLTASGLTLRDIAYCNLVRCRTKDNKSPSLQMTRSCADRFFERWLDWLEPKVVICIGRWSYDRAKSLIDRRGIPTSFVNRQRNLSAEQRANNAREVTQLVQAALGLSRVNPVINGSVTGAQRGPDDPLQSSAPTPEGVMSVSGSSKYWDAESYFRLFESLGFHDIVIGKKLKHERLGVTIYFNKSRSGDAYFTVRANQADAFNLAYWQFVSPRQKRDDHPNYRTVLPRQGLEVGAFRNVLIQTKSGTANDGVHALCRYCSE